MTCNQTTPWAGPVAHAEFAARLAKRLLMFPIAPEAGGDLATHAAALETVFAAEIMAALNEEADHDV